MNKPKIVAITGSTKFKDDFRKIAAQETLAGNVVLTVHVFRHDPEWAHLTEEQCANLDKLFQTFIEMCDEFIVINSNGYIGDGTLRDIEKAICLGKPIRYAFSEQHVQLTIVEHTYTDKACAIERTAMEQLYHDRRFDRLKEALAKQDIATDISLELGSSESGEPGFCYRFPNGQMTITTVMQFTLKNNTDTSSLLRDKIRYSISIFRSIYDPDLFPSWACLMEEHLFNLMKLPISKGKTPSFLPKLGKRFAAAIHITNT